MKSQLIRGWLTRLDARATDCEGSANRTCCLGTHREPAESKAVAAPADAGIVTLAGAQVFDGLFHLQETANHDRELVHVVTWIYSQQWDGHKAIDCDESEEKQSCLFDTPDLSTRTGCTLVTYWVHGQKSVTDNRRERCPTLRSGL